MSENPAPTAGDSGLTREQRAALEAQGAISCVTAAGGASVLTMPEARGSPMLNRAVGLGVERPATEADVDEALAALAGAAGFYVAVTPDAAPAQLPGWLRERGLEPGWGWMTFRRSVEAPPPADTALRLAQTSDAADAAAFARVVRASYGLPPALEPRLARAPEAGWHCWIAYDGDRPAAAAGLYVTGATGYLGLAGSLEEARGRGAQTALLAARIRRAAELGCDMLVTETGERTGDRPSDSYRNILRAGFEEVAVTANWLGRRR